MRRPVPSDRARTYALVDVVSRRTREVTDEGQEDHRGLESPAGPINSIYARAGIALPPGRRARKQSHFRGYWGTLLRPRLISEYAIMNEAMTTRAYLEAKRDGLKAELNRLSEGLKHIEWVLQYAISDSDVTFGALIATSPIDAITAEDLAGLTLKECLVSMAERNGGEITSGEARKKLVAIGMLDDDPASRSRIWEAFQRSKRFENVERGHYRLLPDESQGDGLVVGGSVQLQIEPDA